VVAGTTRIGVAVAVPEPWGSQLDQRREEFGDSRPGAIPAHVTLLPPMMVATSALPEVEAHLHRAAASVRRFGIHLRGTGTFRPVSAVVFVALASGIAGCESLEAVVRTGLLARELEFPYHPHVTVAHDVPDDVLDQAYDALGEFSARFTVESFTLYVHGADGAWQARRSFDLAD
jgi:2'-5' RNA ligase